MRHYTYTLRFDDGLSQVTQTPITVTMDWGSKMQTRMETPAALLDWCLGDPTGELNTTTGDIARLIQAAMDERQAGEVQA